MNQQSNTSIILLVLLATVATFLGSCNDFGNPNNTTKEKATEKENKKLETISHLSTLASSNMEQVTTSHSLTEIENLTAMEKQDVSVKEPISTGISANELAFNLFDRIPDEKDESLTPIPLKELRVSTKEWETIIRKLLQEPFEDLKSDGPDDFKAGYPTLETFFNKYFELHQLITGGNKNIKKQLEKDWKANFFDPVGQFVVLFESAYEHLRSKYIKNTEENSISHLEELNNQIFPIIQKTFNALMQIYEQYASEKLGKIGPLKYKSENFFVLSDCVKYIFYKRDVKGNYSIFTLYPHQKIGDNLYQSYVSYPQNLDSTLSQGDCFIIFSLDRITQAPVINDHAGLFLEKDNKKGFLIMRYFYGNTLSFHGNSGTIAFPTTSAANIALDQVHEIMPLFKEKEVIEKEEVIKRKEITTFIENSLPTTAKNGSVIIDIQQFNLGHDPINTITELSNRVLGNSECAFIPFPHTDREENEETYLFLLDLQGKLAKQQDVQPMDKLFVKYLEDKVYPGKNIDQIIEAYEEELIDEYAKEEEAKIRLEQEARSRMVATGELDQKLSQAKSTQKKKRGGAAKRAPEKHTNTKKDISLKEEVQDQSNNNAAIHKNERLVEESKAKARKKLEILKEVNKKGSIKFRKFMQLVNVARQVLVQSDSSLEVELNGSSHGTIKAEGTTPQTIVRPHGGSKEKSVSSYNKTKILTSLVKTAITKLSRK